MDKQKIILIEDDKFIREIYVFSLEKAGFIVLSSVDGDEGLKTAFDNPDVKLILLDVIMPKMNGVETLRKLKSNPLTQNIPVILLSNLTDDEIVNEAMELGAYSFIAKSQISQMELVDRVKEVIKSSAGKSTQSA
jgi:PleD family two-component response regulator